MQDNRKLFEFIYETVISDGGDGDIAVISMTQDHKLVADQFESFLQEGNKYGTWHRQAYSNGDIIFSCDQESFTFSNEDHFCYWRELDDKARSAGKIPCAEKLIIS